MHVLKQLQNISLEELSMTEIHICKNKQKKTKNQTQCIKNIECNKCVNISIALFISLYTSIEQMYVRHFVYNNSLHASKRSMNGGQMSI